MTVSNPKVLIVCRKRMRDVNFLPSDLERLSIDGRGGMAASGGGTPVRTE